MTTNTEKPAAPAEKPTTSSAPAQPANRPPAATSSNGEGSSDPTKTRLATATGAPTQPARQEGNRQEGNRQGGGGQNRDNRSGSGNRSDGSRPNQGQRDNSRPRDDRPREGGGRDGGQRPQGGQRPGEGQARPGEGQRQGDGQRRDGGGQRRDGGGQGGGQREGGAPRSDGSARPQDGARRDGGSRPPYQGDRPPRPAGDRPPYQGDRSARPAGDRPPYQGDRPPRPAGDRPPYQGDRSARPAGDRPPRPAGDRPPRPAGDRPPYQGDRSSRPPGGGGGPARTGDRSRTGDQRPGGRGDSGRSGRAPDASRGRGGRNDRDRGRDGRKGVIDPETALEAEARLAREAKAAAAKEIKVLPTEVAVEDFITVRELAQLMHRSPIDLIKILMQYGIMAPITHSIDHDTAVILGEELGVKVKRPKSTVEVPEEVLIIEEIKTGQSRVKQVLSAENTEFMADRSPVVAVLGHVDHGKTSLLDRIRHTDVASGEAGGITQRTGAYQVMINGKKITFLDTPGHEAFTAMRARGARVTDIVVLVVAADDGVMPQTKEAISHAQAAGVQIVVALNKVDKPNANPERVMQELADLGLQAEQWGGDTIVTPVSALRNQGVDTLLENILVVAELQEYKANPKGKLIGTVIEASLDRFRGVTATLLIQNGTLRAGDSLVVGTTWGRIKALFDYEGKPLKVAGPSTPVVVLGLQEAPQAGDLFERVETDRQAREIAEQRKEDHASSQEQKPRMSLEELFAKFEGGETKTLNLIVRADLQGTLEPVLKSLQDLTGAEIEVKILQSAVGNISESDVMLAEASDAVIIGFSVSVDKAAANRAEQAGIEIRQYNVIYKMIEDVQDALKGMLDPIYENMTVAHANVLQLFKLRRGFIAGCMVTDGQIKRNSLARILRAGVVLQDNLRIDTLRRFTEDASEVRQGFECGIKLNQGDEHLQIGDVIEVFERQRIR